MADEEPLWFYADAAGTICGPVPMSHIHHWIAGGMLEDQTMVIQQGGSEWVGASYVDVDGHTVSSSAPASPSGAVEGVGEMEGEGEGEWGVEEEDARETAVGGEKDEERVTPRPSLADTGFVNPMLRGQGARGGEGGAPGAPETSGSPDAPARGTAMGGSGGGGGGGGSPELPELFPGAAEAAEDSAKAIAERPRSALSNAAAVSLQALPVLVSTCRALKEEVRREESSEREESILLRGSTVVSKPTNAPPPPASVVCTPHRWVDMSKLTA
jgi:hypothetical protein